MECTLRAAFALLKCDSALSSLIRAFTYLVGLAITVYSEPANEVATPPLAARVIAGPPTDVIMLSATLPITKEEKVCVLDYHEERLRNYTHVAVAKTALTSDVWSASQVEAVKMLSRTYYGQ